MKNIFGFKLKRSRRQRGYTHQQVAQYLGLPLREYVSYEMGMGPPELNTKMALSHLLDISPSKMREWEEADQRHAEKEAGLLSQAVTQTKETFQKKYNRELNFEERKVFGRLKRELYQTHIPKLLPHPCLQILNALEQAKDKTYLYEIICEGEPLPAIITRDFILGPFVFFAANLLFFPDRPSLSIQDCVNRLSVHDFENLLPLMLESGVCSNTETLSLVQKYGDFSELVFLMIQELSPHLPDAEELEKLSLLQGIGVFVLCDKLPRELDKNYFEEILWGCHPAVSALLARKWQYPEALIHDLYSHHEQPISKLTPLCANLKALNFFVACLVENGLPNLSGKEINDLMRAYPNFKVPVETLYRACVKLNAFRLKQKREPMDLVKCLARVREARVAWHLMWPGEGMDPYLKRISRFQVQKDYLKTKDLQETAHNFKTTVEEVQSLLGFNHKDRRVA